MMSAALLTERTTPRSGSGAADWSSAGGPLQLARLATDARADIKTTRREGLVDRDISNFPQLDPCRSPMFRAASTDRTAARRKTGNWFHLLRWKRIYPARV